MDSLTQIEYVHALYGPFSKRPVSTVSQRSSVEAWGLGGVVA